MTGDFYPIRSVLRYALDRSVLQYGFRVSEGVVGDMFGDNDVLKRVPDICVFDSRLQLNAHPFDFVMNTQEVIQLLSKSDIAVLKGFMTSIEELLSHGSFHERTDLKERFRNLLIEFRDRLVGAGKFLSALFYLKEKACTFSRTHHYDRLKIIAHNLMRIAPEDMSELFGAKEDKVSSYLRVSNNFYIHCLPSLEDKSSLTTLSVIALLKSNTGFGHYIVTLLRESYQARVLQKHAFRTLPVSSELNLKETKFTYKFKLSRFLNVFLGYMMNVRSSPNYQQIHILLEDLAEASSHLALVQKKPKLYIQNKIKGYFEKIIVEKSSQDFFDFVFAFRAFIAYAAPEVFCLNNKIYFDALSYEDAQEVFVNEEDKYFMALMKQGSYFEYLMQQVHLVTSSYFNHYKAVIKGQTLRLLDSYKVQPKDKNVLFEHKIEGAYAPHFARPLEAEAEAYARVTTGFVVLRRNQVFGNDVEALINHSRLPANEHKMHFNIELQGKVEDQEVKKITFNEADFLGDKDALIAQLKDFFDHHFDNERAKFLLSRLPYLVARNFELMRLKYVHGYDRVQIRDGKFGTEPPILEGLNIKFSYDSAADAVPTESRFDLLNIDLEAVERKSIKLTHRDMPDLEQTRAIVKTKMSYAIPLMYIRNFDFHELILNKQDVEMHTETYIQINADQLSSPVEAE